MLADSLSKMLSLQWLNIRSTRSDKESLNFLHKLMSPPRLLRFLRIGPRIDGLPDWVRSLNNLVEIFIAWTYFVEDQLFGPLYKLPNLKHMTLEAYYYKDPTLVAQTAHNSPALKDMHVSFDIDGMEDLEFEDGSMEKLETLSVRFLDRESKGVFGIEHLKSLTEVKLAGKKGNPALDRAVQQLKTVNKSRPESNQIKVAVIYE